MSLTTAKQGPSRTWPMWPSSDQHWKVRHLVNHVLGVTEGTWLVHVGHTFC